MVRWWGLHECPLVDWMLPTNEWSARRNRWEITNCSLDLGCYHTSASKQTRLEPIGRPYHREPRECPLGERVHQCSRPFLDNSTAVEMTLAVRMLTGGEDTMVPDAQMHFHTQCPTEETEISEGAPGVRPCFVPLVSSKVVVEEHHDDDPWQHWRQQHY